MKTLKLLTETDFGRVEVVQLDDDMVGVRKTFAPSARLLSGGVDIDKLRKRFAREVRIQRRLPENMFIPIWQSDLDATPPWFVMPPAESTFEQELEQLREQPRRLHDALSEILESLGRLHALGYVHRDLKPPNILFHDGRWKLADFGLVMPPVGQGTKLTSQLSAWGTREYCAPEQVAGFGNVTYAADIYAFGCILHDLFGRDRWAGRVPYGRVTCAGPMGAVVEKCTEVDAKRRFKSVDGLRATLFDVLARPPEMVETAYSREAGLWADKLESVGSMTTDELGGLAQFVRGLADPTEAVAVFVAFNEERIAGLQQRDVGAWTEVARQYCEWAKTPNFDFQYCDVIALRLMVIYQYGDIEMKANAALAAAQLGESHNRWFVMNRVLDMCGPSVDENVAHRIAIEIRASEMQVEFRKCALEIGKDLTAYHPLIRAAIPQEITAPAQNSSGDIPF